MTRGVHHGHDHEELLVDFMENGVGEASDLGLADGPVSHLGAFGESQDLLYLGVHSREKASSELGLVIVVKLCG